MTSETWRVVLAPRYPDGAAEERQLTVAWVERFGGTWTCGGHGYHRSPRRAVMMAAFTLDYDAAEILAPGEPTRAELAAQLAAVTAERDALRAEHAADCDLIARQSSILTAVANALKGPPPALSSHSHHDLGAVAAATVAQQAPLVACVDALRAAARDAGWRDADATGEHLVAWVRRGAMTTAAGIAMERGGERVAKAIVARANEEGGE